ncbi:hypothetical protein [Streptomyces vietnamensis]|uniref:Lipoprotein n=1 Tax=Streptomyces vietnamensis TaxID=362257 RepID=A0A0B5HWX5_9ACTN|nr:hypothetical protein [Streptomyces vietnamensis]AJF64946.1 hypothetical protein SVTN_11425 [Streptomyces vietnamensis]
MRKAMWVAAAAGVALLVSGCGSEGGTDKGGSSSAGSSSAGSASTGGSGGGSEAGDGTLTADAVSKEIESAATAAGFAEDPTGDPVAPELKNCMVTWNADAEKAADPKKSYDGTVTALAKGGWAEGKGLAQGGSEIKTFTKSGWQLKASNHSTGPLKMVMFIATDTGPECEALFAADLKKNKKP